MGKLRYFPVMIDRWMSGTRALTYEQKGFYMDLLLWMFETGKPVKDAAHAARILGCDPRISRRLLGDLSGKFCQTSAGLRHKLVDELIRNGGKIRGLQPINFPLDQDQSKELNKKVIHRQQGGPSQTSGATGWRKGIEQAASALGMQARPGESWEVFDRRLKEEQRRRRHYD